MKNKHGILFALAGLVSSVVLSVNGTVTVVSGLSELDSMVMRVGDTLVVPEL